MRDDLKDLVRLYFKEISKKQSLDTKHIVLILDRRLQHLPWESLPIFRKSNSSISRLPSFSVLANEPKSVTVNRERVFYVINPSGDLTRTQSQMEKMLLPFSGIAGRPPSKEEYIDGIQNNSLFMYETS